MDVKEWKESAIKGASRIERVLDKLQYRIAKNKILIDEDQKIYDTLKMVHDDTLKYTSVRCGGG